MPAFSIGIMDPHGTRMFASQYLVASRQIYPFDLTVGFGNGRFGREQLPAQGEGVKLEMFNTPRKWAEDSRLFWGIQFAPSEKYALMVEYSPIRYHERTRLPGRSKYFPEPVPSRYNFGFRYRPARWSEIDVSYQRGEQVGINFSMAFDIGKPLIPLYDPPYRETRTAMASPLAVRMTAALYHSGFSDIAVEIKDRELQVTAQNDRYYYNTKAVRVILGTIKYIMPEDIKGVRIILRENGVPLFEFVAGMTDLTEVYSNKLTHDELLYLSALDTATLRSPDVKGKNKRLLQYGMKPSLETFLNDPSGFFKYRFGISAWSSLHPWKGGTFVAGIASYPLNNISTVNEPLSIPVRTDLASYKEEKVNLNRLMFDQAGKLPLNVYVRLSAGLLETQYGGVDAEAAFPAFDGRLLLGISGSAVKKRAHDSILKFKEDPVKDVFTTAFVNARINFPETDLSFDVKAGRFLAGDPGAKFTISKFMNGVILKVWYTVTDTSVFSDDSNRGYNDKGFGVTVPVRFFTGMDSRTGYEYSLSSWTRDTGQDIDHYNSLFDLIGRNTGIYLRKDWKAN